MTSKDIAEDAEQAPRRWIIDFASMPLEEAEDYPTALQIVRTRVKPVRDKNRDKRFREYWWRFGRPRGEMRKALSSLPRFVAGTRHGVRLHFCWCLPPAMASDATNVFAFSDDYAMGVLCCTVHGAWAWAQSSTIRQDIRYTPTSAFERFPWPAPSEQQREAVAAVCKDLFELRSTICAERRIGLTELYNEIADGAHRDLRDLHRGLDRAVVAAYGWPASVAEDRDESNRRLLELNLAISAGEVDYRGPG